MSSTPAAPDPAQAPSSRALRTLRLDPARPDAGLLAEAAKILRAGGLVAFPTETVYGLAADATDPKAVGRIFQVKGRPPDNPLIVHVAGTEALGTVAQQIPDVAHRFMQRFWPGPLTLVLPAHPGLPRIVTAGLDTVAVRSPAHPVAQALLSAAKVPLAAPSANRSGMPSPTRAEHVLADFKDRGDEIGVLLDAGPCTIGVESTVLDLTSDPPVVLRLGGVSPQQLMELTPVRVHSHARGVAVAPGTSVASPGMKHRHYAPLTPLVLYEGPGAGQRMVAAHDEAQKTASKVALIVTEETAREQDLSGPRVWVLGPRGEPETWAHELFHALRRLDQTVDQILVEGIPEKGLGAAVMDRLRRAARAVH